MPRILRQEEVHVIADAVAKCMADSAPWSSRVIMPSRSLVGSVFADLRPCSNMRTGASKYPSSCWQISRHNPAACAIENHQLGKSFGGGHPLPSCNRRRLV